MGLCFPNRRIALCLFAAVAVLDGCSDAVQLTHETESGGVVTYLFKEDRGGPMGSPHRKVALKLIDTKCPGGYFVVRDGEMKGYGSMSSVEGQEGEITGRRWGIQFRCK
jgi:hypothetical protein